MIFAGDMVDIVQMGKLESRLDLARPRDTLCASQRGRGWVKTRGTPQWRFSGLDARNQLMAKSETIRVLLIRSGATQWDEAGRLAGDTDLPLCDLGKAAVQEQLGELNGTPISVLLTAPDEASVATAEVFAEATGAKVKKLADLAEVDLGLWEGLRPEDLEDKYPTVFRHWLDDPGSVNAPEGESMADASERITRELAKVAVKFKDDGQAVGIILRPMALALIRGWLDNTPTTEFWRVVREGSGAEWRTIPRATFLAAKERVRAET